MRFDGRARRGAGAIVLAGFTLSCGGSEIPARSVAEDEFAPTLIRDVRVFDGERVIPSATVLLADRHIAAVTVSGETMETPPGTIDIDGSGKTLIPGLIDAHTHTQSAAQLMDALFMGVTTQLDMFTDLAVMRGMREEQEAGTAARRADLFSAGTLVTAPGGHPVQNGGSIPTLADADDADDFVAARLEEGSDYIKIVYDDGSAYGMSAPTLDRATLEAAIDAAHARGAKAVVHIGTLEGARDAIEAGADGLVHIFAAQPPDAGFGELAFQRGTFVVPTLAVIENVSGEAGGHSVVADPVLGPRLSPEDIANLEYEIPAMPGNRTTIDNALAAVAALHGAGATVLAGSDAPNPGTVHGASLHRELELLVRAGLTPIDALHAATAAIADAFGLDDRGRIAPGLRADVVLVDGDPTADILESRRIAEVWKEGRRYKSELHLQSVTARRTAFEAELGGPPPAGAESGWVSDFDEPGGIGEPPRTRFGFGWDTSDDGPAGSSTVELRVVAGGADGSAGAMAVEGAIRPGGRPPFAGAMLRPGEEEWSTANMSSFAGLSFQVRGDGGTYVVFFYDATGSSTVGSREFEARSEWTEVTVPFAALETDGRGITGILFAAVGAPRDFSFRIDSIRFR